MIVCTNPLTDLLERRHKRSGARICEPLTARGGDVVVACPAMPSIGVPAESAPGETRVALVPQSLAKLTADGWTIVVEAGAGFAAGFADHDYESAGADVADRVATLACDVILGVSPPTPDFISAIREGATVAGFLEPYTNEPLMRAVVARGQTAIAMEAIPRTTLAQSMDALSSQTNLAGYAAVLLAANESPKLLPMMVTAAGTIAPARVLILGVGVAGLQAIATARRLGAVVHAYDIRPETAEQVESLGAKFVAAPTASADDGGYAVEVTGDTQALQHAALAPFVADADIVVTTAQIPGRPAPLLVTAAMVETMHAGSVIVDMAAGTGGNVELSRPDEVVTVDGVRIYGPTNLAAAVPGDASRMYSRNLTTMLERLGSLEEELAGDAIFGEAAVVIEGEPNHPRTRELLGLEVT